LSGLGRGGDLPHGVHLVRSPGFDGLTLRRRVKAEPRTRHIVVVAPA